MFEHYIRESCLLVLVISGVPLLASAVSGLVVAVLQAATQIQEQSISYVAKLSAAAACCVLLWNWAQTQLVLFLQESLDSFSFLGRG